MVNPLTSRLRTGLSFVLRPIARLMLHQGIGARPIIELLKFVMVDIATAEFGKPGKTASISAVSRLTGLSRKEVRRLRDKGDFDIDYEELSRPDRSYILSHWYKQDRFLDKNGQPKELEIGPGPGTFTDLVLESTGGDAVEKHLNRLLEENCVSLTADNKVCIERREWTIADDLPKLFGEAMGSLANTIDKNWRRDPVDSLCQRTVYTSIVDPDKVGIFRRVARDRISSFTEEIDDLLVSVESDSGEPFYDTDGQELLRLGVGAFYFEIERPPKN